MVRYAPNISWLFPELPFGERPRAVAEAGFQALEFGFPSHADLPALRHARAELGLDIVLFNLDVPVWDAANRGYLVDPERRDEFRRRLDEALEMARDLHASKIMLPAGVELEARSPASQWACMVENLRYAGPLAAEAGVLLTIEALNPFDNPGYFLTSSRGGFEVVRQVAHPNVKFQFDTYHMQLQEGNLIQTIQKNIEAIGHIQFADVPGRHEPGTGEINFDNVANAIAATTYDGDIGLEYVPQAAGMAALAWALRSAACSQAV
jgi:hydroxypyruvate isomerase